MAKWSLWHKAKYARVVHKKVYEAIDDNVLWPCGGVVQVTFYDNMFMGLNFGFVIWTTSGKMKEESLSILSNGSMTGGHASESSAQRVCEAYERKLWLPFSIYWFNNLLFFVFEI